MKVLHCPTDTGNNAWTLSRAERALGVDSEVMVFRKSWLGYDADIDLRLNPKRPLYSTAKLVAFFVSAARKYDVFHFNFGSSFIPQMWDWHLLELADVRLLKALGKRIVVTYQGCDLRQRQVNLAPSFCNQGECTRKWCTPARDRLRAKRAGIFSSHADKVFALNPDLLNLLPPTAEFLPYTTVDLGEWQPVKKAPGNRLIVVHAPSSRGIKGTKYIIEAVDRLKAERYNVKLTLVENTPRNKAKELYSQADIAVDQLLGGWYGGFAVEMMALGIPVIAYMREADLKFIPDGMAKELPVTNAMPNTIYRVLLSVLRNKDQLAAVGRDSRDYVCKWHNPVDIAERVVKSYV